MQIGNPLALNAERRALLDAFDSVWMAEDTLTTKGTRAVHCAQLLARAELFSRSPNTIIGRGWRLTAPTVILAETGASMAQSKSTMTLFSVSNALAGAALCRTTV
ncbi:hypothetical protein [Bradyrhizobium cenepequi]